MTPEERLAAFNAGFEELCKRTGVGLKAKLQTKLITDVYQTTEVVIETTLLDNWIPSVELAPNGKVKENTNA